MASKCIVCFTEVNSRIAHEIQVEAAFLYEAVARAMKILKDSGWNRKDLRSDLVEVSVFPKQPVIKHRVLMKNFQSWLCGESGSPEDVERRKIVKDILSGRPRH